MYGESYDGTVEPYNHGDEDGVYIRNNRIYDDDTRMVIRGTSEPKNEPDEPVKRSPTLLAVSSSQQTVDSPHLYSVRKQACDCSGGMATSHFGTGGMVNRSFLDMKISLRDIMHVILFIMIVILIASQLRGLGSKMLVVYPNQDSLSESGQLPKKQDESV